MISDILAKAIKDITQEAEAHPELYKEDDNWSHTMVQYTVGSLETTRKYFKSTEEAHNGQSG